eukprot:10527915-Ditylum_brightwellii.AAC.2
MRNAGHSIFLLWHIAVTVAVTVSSVIWLNWAYTFSMLSANESSAREGKRVACLSSGNMLASVALGLNCVLLWVELYCSLLIPPF